MEQRSHCTV